jgi:Uma2 family endonuclease
MTIPGFDERRLELIDGEVCEKPMRTWGHGHIAGRLFAALDPHGHASVEPRAMIPGTADRGDSSVLPDVAFYLSDPPGNNDWMRRPPDIAVEVLSPGQSRPEMRAKVDIYRAFGVRSVWVVDPEWGLVDIYEGAGRRTVDRSEVLTTPVVPALRLPVRDILGEAGA